jgi:hypothetical protein
MYVPNRMLMVEREERALICGICRDPNAMVVAQESDALFCIALGTHYYVTLILRRSIELVRSRPIAGSTRECQSFLPPEIDLARRSAKNVNSQLLVHDTNLRSLEDFQASHITYVQLTVQA